MSYELNKKLARFIPGRFFVLCERTYELIRLNKMALDSNNCIEGPYDKMPKIQVPKEDRDCTYVIFCTDNDGEFVAFYATEDTILDVQFVYADKTFKALKIGEIFIANNKKHKLIKKYVATADTLDYLSGGILPICQLYYGKCDYVLYCSVNKKPCYFFTTEKDLMEIKNFTKAYKEQKKTFAQFLKETGLKSKLKACKKFVFENETYTFIGLNYEPPKETSFTKGINSLAFQFCQNNPYILRGINVNNDKIFFPISEKQLLNSIKFLD